MAGSEFDLEQAIMACWGTSDDIELVAQGIVNSSDDSTLVDRVVNLLTGLRELHDLRCNRVLDIFTDMLAEKKINNQQR